MFKQTIRAAQARAGYYMRTDDMCNMARIALSTFNKRMRYPATMTIAELRRLDKTVKFTDSEIVGLIRGGD